MPKLGWAPPPKLNEGLAGVDGAPKALFVVEEAPVKNYDKRINPSYQSANKI